MQQLKTKISITTLEKMALGTFNNLIKAVVDIEKRIIVIDAELHADIESFLIKEGSQQKNLWGINLKPHLFNTENFIEYDSMINLRPNQNNQSRGVDDPSIRTKIEQIVLPLIKR